MMNVTQYRGILMACLAAAGCGARYDAFAEERARLDCEITAVCSEQVPACDDEDPPPKNRCLRFRPKLADQCLADMEDWLTRVQDDPTQCQVFDSRACEDVTEWANSRPGCNVDEGRPLLHNGVAVLAAVVEGHSWAPAPLAHELAEGPETRAAGHRWLQSARFEHASIAAFSAIAMQLMQLGAPPELIEGCHRAALDEIRHAKNALRIARTLMGSSVDLGALELPVVRGTSVRELAMDALLQGCIGEAAAAARATVAAEFASQPIAAVLREVAADETRHAALAWSTLRWALSCEPSLATELGSQLIAARVSAQHNQEDRDGYADLGVLSGEAEAEVHREVIDQVVIPVFDALVRAVAVAGRVDVATQPRPVS